MLTNMDWSESAKAYAITIIHPGSIQVGPSWSDFFLGVMPMSLKAVLYVIIQGLSPRIHYNFM